MKQICPICNKPIPNSRARLPSDRDMLIIKQRDEERRTFENIAKEHNLSIERIRQIVFTTKRRLYQRCNGHREDTNYV